MIIKNFSREDLLHYVTRQLETFFPDGQRGIAGVLEWDLDQALARLRRCINAVRMWEEDKFDYLHSSQYAMFLYFLSNTVWRNQGNERVCTKLFYLNKALNGIDCFYEIQMPEIFFVGHSVGIVLAKAQYENYLVLYQNSTIGKNHGVAPVLEEGVVLYPNTAIIGRCLVRAHSVIAQGVSVVNRDTAGNCLVFRGSGQELQFKELKRDIIADFFKC